MTGLHIERQKGLLDSLYFHAARSTLKNKGGYLALIQSGNYIKIGATERELKTGRLKEGMIWVPEAIPLLFFPCDESKFIPERILLAFFKSKIIRSEMIRFDRDVRIFVNHPKNRPRSE